MTTAEQELPRGIEGLELPLYDDISTADARILAEQDFYWFCVEVCGYPDLHPPLHRDLLCHFLQQFESSDKPVGNLEVARGHFKSTIASICYPLWMLMRDPDLRILIVHGKRDMAVKMLRELKSHLIRNDRLRAIAPDAFWADPAKQSNLWLADQINVRRERENKVPSVTVTGVDSSVVSQHYHLQIHDDLVFKENVGTPDMREKTRQFRRESRSLFERTGGLNKTLNIGTRWHYDDAHQELEDGAAGEGPYAGMVHQLKLGCRKDDGTPLFPTIWTNEELERERQLQGSHVFSCQFENNPVPDGEAYFKRKDFRWFDDLPNWERYPKEGDPQSPYYFYTAVDPNRSQQTLADPAVVMTAAIEASGDIWIVDMSRGHPTGSELVQIIRSHLERWNPRELIVESNNFQLQLCNWIREDQISHGQAWPIRSVVRGPTTRKIDRIGALQPLVERGGLHIRSGFDVVGQELEQWPHAKHDDTLDALSDIYTFGDRPSAVHNNARPPKSHDVMQSVIDDMMGRTRGPSRRARMGGRTPKTNGWMLR